MPPITTRRVRGASNAGDALRQMLSGTGYRAIATGPSSFRIEPDAARPKGKATAVSTVRPDSPQPEIIVTALKRAQSLSRIPATVRVVRDGQLTSPGGLGGSERLASEMPAVSISSLGPGRNRLFLRGIGDGPLNGFNQGSVAILLNEARLNYDAPDPDWALVDIDQIEVLEGPQGPLYGTGALGGIVKIVTAMPDMSRIGGRIQAGVAVTQGGDISNSQSLVFNLPIANDRLAVRALAYRQDQAGWIDNVDAETDSNTERMMGGRLSIRWVPADGWTVEMLGAVQGRRARDSQYVDGMVGALKRPHRPAEPRDVDARLAIVTVKGKVGGLDLTSVTSISRQAAAATYDTTPMAVELGAVGSTMVEDDRDYQLFDQEIRIGTAGTRDLHWFAGASFIKATTDATIQTEEPGGVLPVLALKRSISEAALFGELTYSVTPTLSLGGGARLFSSQVDDEGEQGDEGSSRGKKNLRVSASFNASWTPSADRTFFIRAATAYRPGGINVQPDARQQVYDADELASVEAGTRLRIGEHWSIDATAFAARWQKVQADELLDNGLIATRNAGDARNFGVEADVRWTPSPRTAISLGIMQQKARLETIAGVDAVEDPRLPAVPQTALRLKVSQGFRIGRWKATAGAGLQYVGATHISFDPVLDRRTDGHAVADASMDLTDGTWTISLSGQNLTNSTSDTFAFGNPYRVRATPQRTPLRPRTIGLSVNRCF